MSGGANFGALGSSERSSSETVKPSKWCRVVGSMLK